jgi:hypothetical protein
MTAALMLLVYATGTAPELGWGSGRTLGYGGAGLGLLAGFFAWEARVGNPVFPLWILRQRTQIGAGAVRGLIVTGWFGSFFPGALHLERVRGFSALETGLAFLPMTLAVPAMSLGSSARLMRRFGPLPMVLAGTSLTVAGLAGLAQADEHAAYASPSSRCLRCARRGHAPTSSWPTPRARNPRCSRPRPAARSPRPPRPCPAPTPTRAPSGTRGRR